MALPTSITWIILVFLYLGTVQEAKPDKPISSAQKQVVGVIRKVINAGVRDGLSENKPEEEGKSVSETAPEEYLKVDTPLTNLKNYEENMGSHKKVINDEDASAREAKPFFEEKVLLPPPSNSKQLETDEGAIEEGAKRFFTIPDFTMPPMNINQIIQNIKEETIKQEEKTISEANEKIFSGIRNETSEVPLSTTEQGTSKGDQELEMTLEPVAIVEVTVPTTSTTGNEMKREQNEKELTRKAATPEKFESEPSEFKGTENITNIIMKLEENSYTSTEDVSQTSESSKVVFLSQKPPTKGIPTKAQMISTTMKSPRRVEIAKWKAHLRKAPGGSKTTVKTTKSVETPATVKTTIAEEADGIKLRMEEITTHKLPETTSEKLRIEGITTQKLSETVETTSEKLRIEDITTQKISETADNVTEKQRTVAHQKGGKRQDKPSSSTRIFAEVVTLIIFNFILFLMFLSH